MLTGWQYLEKNFLVTFSVFFDITLLSYSRVFPVIDPLPLAPQSDMATLAIPKDLEILIQEIVKAYQQPQYQAQVVEVLKRLVANTRDSLIPPYILEPQISKQAIANYTNQYAKQNHDEDSETDFLRSWDDILNVQVYIDTDIYGELDPRPPALTEPDHGGDHETIIQHTEASEAYVNSWKELAQRISNYPDDIFTRLWTTIEIAKILECSPSTLRRARRLGRLPVKFKDLIIDCISHDGKRSLWFVRPV